MRATRLTRELERRLNGISLSVYLHMKMGAGWKLWQIQEDLQRRTGIPVSMSSVTRWVNNLGYGLRQAAPIAWKRKLIPQIEMDEPAQPEPPLARNRYKAG